MENIQFTDLARTLHSLIGTEVKCVKESPYDHVAGVTEDKRWLLGDKMQISHIEVLPWGTFLHDGKGHTMNARRAESV